MRLGTAAAVGVAYQPVKKTPGEGTRRFVGRFNRLLSHALIEAPGLCQ